MIGSPEPYQPAIRPWIRATSSSRERGGCRCALGVALQDDLQAGQQHDRQQPGADMALPAAEADDRPVREDRVVEDAGDAVGQEVAGGEAAGAAGEPVLRLGVLVPAGLRVGEAGADPLPDVVQADVRGRYPAGSGPVPGHGGLARPPPDRSAAPRGWPRRSAAAGRRAALASPPGRRAAGGRGRCCPRRGRGRAVVLARRRAGRGACGSRAAAATGAAAPPGPRGRRADPRGAAAPGPAVPPPAAGRRPAGRRALTGRWQRQRSPHRVLHPVPLRLVRLVRLALHRTVRYRRVPNGCADLGSAQSRYEPMPKPATVPVATAATTECAGTPRGRAGWRCAPRSAARCAGRSRRAARTSSG